VPTLREIARQFGFRSMTAAADHVRALRRKGYLVHHPRMARSHSVIAARQTLHRSLVDIPLLGSIPVGWAEERQQETGRCVSVNADSLGLPGRGQLFALEVRGDSMIGRHILDGDIAILERGPVPDPDEVVAALIDRESTLKTFIVEEGRVFLRAENPNCPALVPADELLIQGVLVALVRKCRQSEFLTGARTALSASAFHSGQKHADVAVRAPTR